jgi:hypothetical protein
VETLYTTPDPLIYHDTANFVLYGGPVSGFSIDFSAVLGYARVANSGNRFVRFWKISEGLYGIHIKNSLNFSNDVNHPETIKDAFLTWNTETGTAVVYATADDRETLMGFGSSIVSPDGNRVFFTEVDRVGSIDTYSNPVNYVMHMDTGVRTVVKTGIIPRYASWVQ